MSINNLKIIIISLILLPFLVFAHHPVANGETAHLPNPGLTPESPFYFLDRLGEALQEFFTFNPERRARLQVEFAAERVAEIKIILETKGVEAKGLDVAQSRLQAHLVDAATIITEEKSKGKDVSSLAGEIDDEVKNSKSALAQSFKEQERVLEAKEDELESQLKAAHRVGDTAREQALAQELGQVKAQLELLELKEEDIEEEIEVEEEKIEEEIEIETKAEKAIREAEEEKDEVIEEAAEEGVELPADAFAEFDRLLTQAKTAFEEGNFVEARNFAKQAEESLERVEETIEELEEAIEELEEEQEELEEEQEEKEKDIDEDEEE